MAFLDYLFTGDRAGSVLSPDGRTRGYIKIRRDGFLLVLLERLKPRQEERQHRLLSN